MDESPANQPDPAMATPPPDDEVVDLSDHDALIGYRVEAVDGSAGKIDSASHDMDPEHLVVTTGGLVPHKVVVETDAVRAVDHDEHVVEVDRVKEWVKQSPRLKQYQASHT